jgi:hypothetical protein
MDAVRLEEAPLLDGIVLSDAAWANVVPANGFRQVRPDNGAPSSQQTDVRIGYTDDALYISVVAHDDDPDGIIISDSRRDADLDDTDAFLVVIDGLLDRQNGFVFGTNAAGVEYDGQVSKDGAGGTFGTSGGFNENWDGSWSVRSQVGDHGWSAEFEIPFRTLRYGTEDEQVWGINFQGNIRRNNEVAYWAPLDRDWTLYRVSSAGTLRGIRPPAQRNFQVTPYVLGSTRRGGGLSGSESNTEAGIDIKYSITPSLTLDLTVNTDFAQVEADEQQLNLDRFNLFFPEKRPFFLENAGQFSVGNPGEVELFFSRRIGIGDDGDVIPVDGGARLSGKIGNSTNVGLLYMSTDGVDGVAPQNTFVVARINEELPNRSAVGAMFVGRDGDGSFETPSADDHNRAFGIDGRWGIGERWLLSGWLARTDSPGLTGDDTAFSADINYSTEEWRSGLEYTEVGADFNPEVGFLRRSEYRKASGYIMRVIRPKDLWNLLELRPHISYEGFWDFDGFQETGFLHNFTRAGVKADFDIVDGVTVPAGTYDHAEAHLFYTSNSSRPFSYSVRTTIGGRFGGDRVSVAPTLRYRYGEKFQSELSVSYNDFDLPVENGDFTANLARLRLSYSFTPKMMLQALVQHNDRSDKLGTNIRFSWLRSANSGLYLVYNEVDERGVGALPTGREVILKYSHIFDLLH